MKRPFESYILYFLHFLLSISALYGGGSLIIAPDGSILGLQEEWIAETPFRNFLFPGILLLLFMGILPGITLAGLLKNGRNRFFRRLIYIPINTGAGHFPCIPGSLPFPGSSYNNCSLIILFYNRLSVQSASSLSSSH